jgi:hypothetical protein
MASAALPLSPKQSKAKISKVHQILDESLTGAYIALRRVRVAPGVTELTFHASESEADATAIALRPDANPLPKRSRVKLLTKVDRRSVAGKRIGELKATFTASLAEQGRAMTPMLKLRVEQAAMALALAEAGRGRFLRGEGHDRLEAVVTAERRADALVSGLRLVDGSKPKAPSLRAYLESKRGSQ